jgi:hypothetical protein
MESLVERVGAFIASTVSLSSSTSRPIGGFQAALTKSKGHTLPRDVLLLSPSPNPGRVGVIKVHVGLQHVSQGPLANEMVQGAKVAVEPAV